MLRSIHRRGAAQLTDIGREIDGLLASAQAADVAKAHNFQFEECLSDSRRADFESLFSSMPPSLEPGATLIRAQADYFNSEIRLASPKSHPIFSGGNAPAAFANLDEDIWLYRLLDVSAWGSATPVLFDRLTSSLRPGVSRTADDYNAIAGLVSWVNTTFSDERGSFVAQESELPFKIQDTNWPVWMRDRLGLAHLHPEAATPLRLALFRYQVRDVTVQCKKRGFDQPIFAKPTVLDQVPWPHFFPAPNVMQGGRCLSLSPGATPAVPLVCEILHPRIEFLDKHLYQIGRIDAVPKGLPLANLRNAHLDVIRRESGKAGFGAEMDIHLAD